MIQKYTIFDLETKERVKIIACHKDSISSHINDGQGYVEGAKDSATYGINEDGTGFREYSEAEKEDIAFSRKKKFPPNLDISLPDVELNTVIEEYYLGRVAAETWRIENYKSLRQMLYKTRDNDLRDALGKINDPDGDEIIIAEGQAELDEYYAWRKHSVKDRFPKE